MEIKKYLAPFLIGVYLNGMGVWIVAFAGGVSVGPAFIIITTMAIAGLRTWLKPFLLEFFGLSEQNKDVVKSVIRKLGEFGISIVTTGLAFGVLIILKNVVLTDLSVEPFILGILLEILFFCGRGILSILRGLMGRKEV